jgi:methyl-accepting chemotaxis protein
VGFFSWVEFENQIARIKEGGLNAVLEQNGPLEEALEIVIYVGLPALVIGLVGGLIMVRRALRPIQKLTEELEKTDVSNLSDPVPRSGNGDELDRMTAVFNRMKERLGGGTATFLHRRAALLPGSCRRRAPAKRARTRGTG